MQQNIIAIYQDLMGKLETLPNEIAAVQANMNAVKTQLAASEKAMADIEAETAQSIEGKNADERKAKLAAALKTHATYQRFARAADKERADVTALNVDYDLYMRQFTAVGFQARLHAGLMNYLAAAAPGTDIDFNMDPAGKSAAQLRRVNGSNGTGHGANGSGGNVTPSDAADLGL